MKRAALQIETPRDYVLARDVCSYGYFLLAPNLWSPAARTLMRVLDLPGGAAAIRIWQGAVEGKRGKKGDALRVDSDRALSAADKKEAVRQITRMLRLDEDHAHVREFHRLDGRWKKSGRARLFRSPTFFEDVIKTVTSCNVTWPSTVSMNRRLCEAFGRRAPSGVHAFPTAAALARQRPAALRGRCGVGYRDARIVELAQMFVKDDLAGVPAAFFEDPARSDEEIRERLLELPGIGPYAANNVLQLLGRYGHLPLDTESVRHGRTVMKLKGSSRAIMKRMTRHYAPFEQHKFRSYWFELWVFYEAKRGDASTWERETTGKTFTASQF